MECSHANEISLSFELSACHAYKISLPFKLNTYYALKVSLSFWVVCSPCDMVLIEDSPFKYFYFGKNDFILIVLVLFWIFQSLLMNTYLYMHDLGLRLISIESKVRWSDTSRQGRLGYIGLLLYIIFGTFLIMACGKASLRFPLLSGYNS